VGLAEIIGRESIEKGISSKFDRANKFRITRIWNDHGFSVYGIENQGRDERIVIKQFIFDRFRIAFAGIPKLEKPGAPIPVFEVRVTFKEHLYYTIRNHPSTPAQIVIQDHEPEKGSSGYLTIDILALRTLQDLLFHKKLHHSNEVLSRIISYHKLFQFTFSEGSESITSDLALKKGILSTYETYIPTLGKKLNESYRLHASDDVEDDETKKNHSPTGKRESEQQLFKSRLAEKAGDNSYQVDFAELFKGNVEAAEKAISAGVQRARKTGGEKTCFQLPLLTSDIKHFARLPFKCEFSTEDIKELRDDFIGDRSSDFFIGFEMIDVIHRKEFGRLKTFKFPLYYMKVKITESGRSILLDPVGEGRIFLNHLALANMVEAFAKATAGHDRLNEFFQTMAAQSIDISGKLSRIYISRVLPISEEIFHKTREILLGFSGENGKGGIFSGLNALGIECDMESVFLYKAPKVSSQTAFALEEDLGMIMKIATDHPYKFNQSLLGQFLTPEIRTEKINVESFSKSPWIPGALPKSTKRLLNRLDTSDLTLLEGPPGTGKTYAILNLFLHCLCSGKRLLIVSDQKSAIHALTEKIVEYLIGKDHSSAEAKGVIGLWESAIKIVDEIPARETPLSKWVNDLRAMLKIDIVQEGFWPEMKDNLLNQLREVDREMASVKAAIQTHMEVRMAPNAPPEKKVRSKRFHATTAKDISTLCDFLRFLGRGAAGDQVESNRSQSVRYLMEKFIQHRRSMPTSGLRSCYSILEIPDVVDAGVITKLQKIEEFLTFFEKTCPRSQEAFQTCLKQSVDERVTGFLLSKWRLAFPPGSSQAGHGLRLVKSLFNYPLRQDIHDLRVMISYQRLLFKLIGEKDFGVVKELAMMHAALNPEGSAASPLSLEICHGIIDSPSENVGSSANYQISVQEHLERLEKLQEDRDVIIRLQVLAQMENLARFVLKADAQGGTSLATSIASTLDSLKVQKDLEEGAAFYHDLQNKLLQAFPIWICRKQAVPLLFPCVEQSFDLIIVDEATQCRVDDALPLLFRAKKILVVGDEKQTVLAKNSVIDDYLFREFSLEEHLRQTQARGIKGGGSHLFGLVKGIKQAHVMLDEHYRCPPEIIQFSNQYVYNNELRKMQWTPKDAQRSIEIDYSEAKAKESERRDSGQFKGIETDMVDRFLAYIERTIPKIEKETGEKINVETDVAICYFLLKNEPYIKRVKGEFLQRLGRGVDILDGAGAALQGKERDYIFYYWDISRSNMAAFRQGDDVDKRRGELNVLMSRPKKKAFHFLHKDFSTLDHNKATITDFLWKAWNRQAATESHAQLMPRLQNPGPEFVPWRRSSGQLMAAVVDQILTPNQKGGQHGAKHSTIGQQFSVTVGDPQFCVDLMLVSDGENSAQRRGVGLVDLCAFEASIHMADDIVDYYFQLQRATPTIRPLFLFLHELADIRSKGFRRLLRAIAKTDGKAASQDAA
jgi:hypothetical protein